MSSYDYPGPSLFGFETDALRRVASISFHTSPLASLGSSSAGGMNVYVRELSCHTADLGVPVDLFTRRTDPETPLIQEICPGVNVVSIDAGPAGPVDKNDLFDLVPDFVNGMVLYGVQAGVRYDVAHAHYWLSGWAAQLLKRNWNTPYALMFHTTAHMKNAVSPIFQHETQLRGATERQLVQLADSIIAANPDERADLIWRQGGEESKICTIPPGVDTELFAPLDRAECRRTLHLGPNEQILLFVGRIDPIKDIDTLLATLAVLDQREDFVTLLLVGGELNDNGEPVEALAHVANTARQLGVYDRIRFEGSQPQDRLPLYYSASDVTVVTSRYESFGLVAVESMGCCVPVVASRTGGLRFTVEDGVNGFLASPGVPEDFANRIQQILHDSDLAADLAKGARSTAERFSWPNVASSVMTVYQRLADGQREDLCCEEEIFA